MNNSPTDQIRNPNRKIALNKIAFVPGKGSPSQTPQSPNSVGPSIFKGDNSEALSNVQGKQQPVRKSSNEKSKIILQSNQIKAMKKEQSPSPNTIRGPDQGNGYLIKNIKMGGNIENSQRERVICKNKQNFQKNGKLNISVFSEDETNVQSDNEENQQQNFSNLLKKQENQSNYNKPKLANNDCQDKKSPDQRIKVISKKKIVQSPSPPSHQNILLRVKLSPNQNQQQQLATDLIKGMINQTKPQQQFINAPQQIQQNPAVKKIGLGNGMRVLKSPTNKSPTNKEQFQSEMQKHGFMKEIKEINSLNLKLIDSKIQQQSPNNQEEIPSSSQRSNVQGKEQRQREYSPPPSQQLSSSQLNGTNIVRISTKEESPAKNKQEISQISPQPQNNEQVFQFPFQRRARSFSPKQDEDKQNQAKSKSPSPVPNANDEQKRNKPVIAKTNFVIAHKGVLGKGVLKEENTFERSKEVDEWLMGSGESAATAGSSYSNNHVKKQQELEKPIQPVKEINETEEGEEDDWMFKTFDPFKQKQRDSCLSNKQAAQDFGDIEETNKKSGLIGDMRGRGGVSNGFDILDSEQNEQVEEDSPFDLAPEMNKQFQKKIGDSSFIGEEIVPVCDDLNSYIGKLDDLIESKFQM